MQWVFDKRLAFGEEARTCRWFRAAPIARRAHATEELIALADARDRASAAGRA